MAKVLCLGVATLDHVFLVKSLSAQPTKLRAFDYARVGGGMAATAAVAVARLGGSAEFWGMLAEDERGREIVADLEAEGVKCGFIARGARVSPASAILVDEVGERMVCGYSDREAFEHDAELPLERVAQCDAVLADPRWRPAALKLFAAARERGIPSVLDADISPREILRELATVASHPVFSESGLEILAEGHSIEQRLEAVGRLVSGTVGVTLGPGGSLWWIDGRIERVAAPEIKAIDTLGAGDVFHGAFALALAEGKPVLEAARFATAAAALKCLRFGGRLGAPRRSELEAYLAKARS